MSADPSNPGPDSVYHHDLAENLPRHSHHDAEVLAEQRARSYWRANLRVLAILLGVFSKRANQPGAIAGMLAGLSFTLGYIVYFNFIAPERNSAEHWLLGISPIGIGALGALLNIGVTLVVSRITAPPPAAVQDLIDDIRIPSGAGIAHHH